MKAVVPRQSAILYIIGGVGLMALGARQGLQMLKKPTMGAPEGYVPHPGSTDPTAHLLAKRFYDGGFEDKMSKREAALILGVRESAAKERVLDRYRALMKINHPDRGGSPFLSYKVNEAKELLAKTAREEGPSKGHGKRHGHGHGHGHK